MAILPSVMMPTPLPSRRKEASKFDLSPPQISQERHPAGMPAQEDESAYQDEKNSVPDEDPLCGNQGRGETRRAGRISQTAGKALCLDPHA